MTEKLGGNDHNESNLQEADDSGTALNAAVISGGDGQDLTGQAEVPLSKPAAGVTRNIQVSAGQTYTINFDPAAAEAAMEGNDLVLTFEDGARIVFQDAADSEALIDIVGDLIPVSVIASTVAGDDGQGGPESLLETAAAGGALGSGGLGIQEPGLDVINLIDDTEVIPATALTFSLIGTGDRITLSEPAPAITFDASITIDETRGVDAGTDDVNLVGEVLQVGYYDMSDGQGDPDQVAAIIAAGHNPVLITDLSAAELAGIDILFIQNPSNSSYGAEFLANLANVNAAVGNGLVMVLHDRFVDDAESVLPGSAGFNILRDFSDDADIDILDPASVLIMGPGGDITNVNLDGGNSSSHGFADIGSLGGGVSSILSTGDPNNVVTFSYSFGAGSVIYSTIPLDFYLDGNGSVSGFADIYAPNVLNLAASLVGVGTGLPAALTGLGVGFIQVGLSDVAFSFGPEIDPTTLALTTAGGAAFSGQDSGLDTTDGNSIFLFSDPANPTQVLGVEGATPGAAAAAFAGGTGTVLAIFLDPATSELWVGQTEAIEHPDPTSDNEAVSISGLIFLSAADGEGNVGTSTDAMTVTILDDGPMIELKPEGGEGGEGGEGPPMVFEKHLNIFKKPQLLDKNFDGGEYPEFFFPTAEVGLNFDFGVDGPADEGMGFTIALASATDGDDGGPLPTGLQTSQDDLPVNTSYDAENKVLIGFTGADPSDMDSWVFTLELTDFMDNSMATALFTLYQAIEHPDINETQFADPINLNFTITATDGDEDSASVDVVFQVKDDGPGGRFGLEVGTAIADEDGLVPDGDTNGFTDSNADGDNNILTGSGFLGIFGGDFGADGPGAGSGLSFAPQDAPAGLTSRGDAVSYSVSADGQVLTATAGGRTVFTVTLDLDNSEYDLVLSDVIDHIGGFEDGRLDFDLRFVDGDGDFFIREEALSIVIRDAQPTAEDDADMARESGPTIMGNVITGEEFEGGEAPVNPAEADTAGADGIARIASVTHDGVTYDSSSPEFDSETGTVSFITDLNGGFSIVIEEVPGGDPLGKYSYGPPGDDFVFLEVTEQEVFEYVLVDGDGDTSTASLTVDVEPIEFELLLAQENLRAVSDGQTDRHVYSSLNQAGDTVTGFDASAPVVGGDIVDIADLLDGGGVFAGTSLQDAVDGSFVELADVGGNAAIGVDVNGTGNFITLVTLDGIGANDLDDNIVVA